MSAPTIAVTCAASDQGGESVAGGIYTAKLDQTEIYDGFVVPEQVTATADADGLVILNLWPNALGVNGSSYRITARNPDTGKKFFDASVVVPNNPCNLYQIIQNAPFPNVDSAQQALIDVQALVTIANQDVAATNADAQQAAADRLQTGEDRTAASDSAANALTSEQIVVAAHLDITTNWSDKLATAAVQAGIATTGGNTATTQAGISTAQAGLAATAKTAAEAARDASFVTGPKYATEALGRAAVADGVNFMVQGSGDVAALEYRRTSSTVSVLIASYPSKAAVDALGQVFDNTAFTFQGYVSNGAYSANTSYRATDYLRIEGGANYTVTTFIQGNLTHDWYDANKAYISSFISPASVVATVTADAPANARYLRVSNTAGGAADARTGVRATTAKLNIAKVLKIVADNPPVIPSLNVTHGAGTVKTKLDSFDVTQAFMLAQQSAMLNSIDLLSDVSAPLFVNTWAYTKSAYGSTSGTPMEVPILSRVSDDTFTVDPANSAHLSVVQGAVVIKDAALNRYASYGVKDNAAGTVTIFGTLPASISAAQAMHDSNNGQHLSRFGYKGMADYIVEQSQKYSYKKKKPIFYYHPPASGSPVYNDPHIYNMGNTVKLINVTVLGGAGNGGFVAGTNNGISKVCGPDNSDTNLTYTILTKFLPRSYRIASTGAGDGVEIKFNPYGIAGFIDLPVSASRVLYDTDKITVGRVRVQVIGDGATSFHDAIYDAGAIKYLKVPFSGAQEIAIRITLADAVPSVLALHGIYAYAKAPETPDSGFFSSGDVVGFLGDSWTQFPPYVAGETLPLRPDGTTGDGMQFLSVRLKERLAQDGISITTANMGQGGRTSAWGRYWVSKMIALTPKLTHCVICFYVNDTNSPAFPVDSSYTIDPNNMWGTLNVSSGGVKGVVSDVEWFANLEYICTSLLSAGIKPIVLMPSHTASSSQAQNLQQKFLSKIAAGFNTVNADGGRV